MRIAAPGRAPRVRCSIARSGVDVGVEVYPRSLSAVARERGEMSGVRVAAAGQGSRLVAMG